MMQWLRMETPGHTPIQLNVDTDGYAQNYFWLRVFTWVDTDQFWVLSDRGYDTLVTTGIRSTEILVPNANYFIK